MNDKAPPVENAQEALNAQDDDARKKKWAENAAQRMVDHIGGLIEILDRESKMILESPKIDDLKKIGTDKQNALEIYDALLKECGKPADVVLHLDAVDKNSLKEAFQTLRTSMQRNERRLRVALDVSGTLLDCLASAVRDTTLQAKTYDPSGRIRQNNLVKQTSIALKSEA